MNKISKQEIVDKLDTLRKQWPSASVQDRKLLEKRAQLLKIALSRKEKTLFDK